jgi:hypothetical protein
MSKNQGKFLKGRENPQMMNLHHLTSFSPAIFSSSTERRGGITSSAIFPELAALLEER